MKIDEMGYANNDIKKGFIKEFKKQRRKDKFKRFFKKIGRLGLIALTTIVIYLGIFLFIAQIIWIYKML